LTSSLNILYFSIQVKLKNVLRSFYLCKTAISDWITNLGEFPKSFFVKDYAEIIKLIGFHKIMTIMPF